MIRPDLVVAFFEIGSALLICLSIRKLHRDKIVRGVSPWPVAFFAAWGWWNIYWYWFIDAPYAWWAGLAVVATNTYWAGQMVFYIAREKRQEALSAYLKSMSVSSYDDFFRRSQQPFGKWEGPMGAKRNEALYREVRRERFEPANRVTQTGAAGEK